MNIKKIMLITFLLLAVLTIGAVSASEDVSSDNLTVSDDADIIINNNYDSEEYCIDVYNEIDLDDNEYDSEIADITLPKNTKGSFKILNNEDEVAKVEVNKNDDDHWIYDEDDGTLLGTIYLSDFDLTKVKDGDELSFKFFELSGGNYVAVDSFTVVCKVTLTASTMKLTEIGGGISENDVDIQVNNINTNTPDENFTYINVTQKEGIFLISSEDDEELFREDLNTTKRHYDILEDEYGDPIYRFGFSFTDINNYIAQNSRYASFNDMVNNNIISNGNEIYFELDDYEGNEIYSITMTITINPDGRILFKDEDVEVDYMKTEVPMEDGWQETEILEFAVKPNINGKIVIYLNDDENPAFEKNLSELTPTEYSDEDFNYYTISINDLNITQAGKYTIRDYFYDETETAIYNYDEEDPEILIVYNPQTMTVDGVTVEIHTLPKTVNSDESLITIDSTASADDEISIYIDENKNPIKILIGECDPDDDGNYIISPKKLRLEVGEHNLTVTYKGRNLTAEVNLTLDLIIEFPEDEIVYTNLNDTFVFISLEENDIISIEGTINLTILDNGGNIVATWEKDLDELTYIDNERIIHTGNLDVELNGNYTVVVQYLYNNKTIVNEEGTVTFKIFNSTDYGTSIKEIIKDNEYAITFADIPLNSTIIVEIDGNQSEIEKTDLENWFDNEKRTYYIKNDRLNGLSDGYHSINVKVYTNTGIINLASGNILVDLEENTDPALTISIADIEEGNAANILITTNSTFTGEILMQVANANYTVNVINGQGNLSVPDLKAGTYNATAFFKSNGIFNDSVKTATFTVTSKAVNQDKNPVTPNKKANVIKLTLKKVKVKKSAKKVILQATLKINGKVPKKGTKITFKFKGKKYIGKTNKKGVAKVTIKKKVLKKLKVGKKITYTAKYSNKTVKKTVKIKK